ncbi:unnamed protein product, partial [Ectocarpus sp. 12 AP-2014]
RINRGLVALVFGVASVLAAVFTGLASVAAQSEQSTAEQFQSDSGDIFVWAVQQMSVVIQTPDGVIYTDPTGSGRRYAGYHAPDLILISHEHGEHYDARTLKDLVGPSTRIVVPPYVMERLPESLRGSAFHLQTGKAWNLELYGSRRSRLMASADRPNAGIRGDAATPTWSQLTA